MVNASKHVFYRNIFIFIDRLKDLAKKRLVAMLEVITKYFYSTALI